VLLAAYLKMYKGEYQPHPLTYELFKGDYVQIVLQNGIAQNGGKDQHPWHLVSTAHTHTTYTQYTNLVPVIAGTGYVYSTSVAVRQSSAAVYECLHEQPLVR
jgi:hypothetical protein